MTIELSFEDVWEAWQWTPIADCPGRFRLVTSDDCLPLAHIIGTEIAAAHYKVAAARDEVLVAVLTGGGIISYARTDGTILHTLNTADGFDRKLRQLGILNAAGTER